MELQEYIDLGFKPLPHFTVANNHIYDLGRSRHLSVGNAGTPNETIFICEVNYKNSKQIDDLICIHNYDYDGYMTKERLIKLLEYFNHERNMESKQFVEQKISELYSKIEGIEIKYEYRKITQCHIIEINPLCYENKDYMELEIEFENEFEKLYPAEKILFVSEGSLIEIKKNHTQK